MPLIQENRMLELARANKQMLYALPFTRYERARALTEQIVNAPGELNIDHIRTVYAGIRSILTEDRRTQGKANRPWDVDPELYAKLDRTQPWWGWEFELGYKNPAAYAEGVGYAYDNFNGATFDGEGEGHYPVEITFPPEEMSKYLDGTAQAHRFMQWNCENAARICTKTDNTNVGSHLNMSDPRLTNPRITQQVANFLNRTLQHCRKKNGERTKLFGREILYAGFFTQASGKNNWMEFKGFRTTYDAAQWADYQRTAVALQVCIEKFFEVAAANKNRVDTMLGVNNLYEVAFEDADPTVDTFANRVIAKGAKQLSCRGGAGDTDYLGGAILMHNHDHW